MSLQYEVFPGGQPSRYYPRPTGFDFGDRTRPGFFPCGMIVRQEMFVNICHIVVPKEKTVNLQQLQITFNF